MRPLLLLLACVLAGCAGQPAPLAAACDGDRGIGGTGIFGEDRGIGGTGIVGTGIVGTVTSVGRVCVNGFEVALDGGTALEIDGGAATPDALRVGQVVAIATDASAGPARLRAARLAVRHVVTGEVEQVAGDMARIAGQAVALPAGFTAVVRPGARVAVSGLRRLDGVIVASRLDPRPPGVTRVTGLVERRGGALWVGGARLRAPARLPEGQIATLAGRYAGGVLRVADVLPEPAVPFGAPLRRLVAQAFVTPERGGLRLGQGPWVRRADGLGLPALPAAMLVELAVAEDGGMVAVGLRAEGRGDTGDGARPAGPRGLAQPGLAPAAPGPAAPAPGMGTGGPGTSGAGPRDPGGAGGRMMERGGPPS